MNVSSSFFNGSNNDAASAASPAPLASYEAVEGKVKKALLCFSGGLDSSVMVPWIKENYGCEVATYTADIGQLAPGEAQALEDKALLIGACEAHVVDLKEEFAHQLLAAAIKANADYQGGYHLSTPLGRIVTAEWAVKTALANGCDAIAHGCTGKGNDQVRFDAYVQMLAPSLKIIAPVRSWCMGRDEEYAYAEAHGVPVENTGKRAVYSHDDNLWGYTAEGGAIEDPALVPPFEEFLRLSVPAEAAPDESELVTIGFSRGVPVSLNGIPMALYDLIDRLNHIAGAHGVGVTVLVEDRIVGLKVRGVYEAPAARTLIAAHKDLEKLVLTRDVLEFKANVDQKWALAVYDAKWFSPLRTALDAFIDDASQRVSGEVTVKLYKGNAAVVAVQSPYALFDHQAASFDVGGGFNVLASAPFIEHYAYATKVYHQVGANAQPVVPESVTHTKAVPVVEACATAAT